MHACIAFIFMVILAVLRAKQKLLLKKRRKKNKKTIFHFVRGIFRWLNVMDFIKVYHSFLFIDAPVKFNL